MKAIYIEQHGGPEVLKYTTDFPIPEIGKDEVLIKVKATSLNRIDLVMRNGYPGMTTKFPFILGGDIAGIIESTGTNVNNLKNGDRVVCYPVILPEKRNPVYSGLDHLNDGWQYFGMHRNGSYAEYISVPAENCIIMPENLNFIDAATLPIAGITAYHAVSSVADIKKGDTFMIWGGTGGFGAIALQIAKLKGAEIIATTGHEEKRGILQSLGADYIFNHNSDDVEAEVRKLFPGGIDVILDYVGPKTFDITFRLIRKNGKILLCGMLSGREVTLNIQQTYFRHINIHGLYLGTIDEFKTLAELVGKGDIKPHVSHVYPLEEAQKAHEMLESGNSTGKIVLTID